MQGGHQLAEKRTPKHLTCWSYSNDVYSIKGWSDIIPLFFGSLGPKSSKIVKFAYFY